MLHNTQRWRTRIVLLWTAAGLFAPAYQAQTDWPVYGHDPGGMRYSPLKQINVKNVSRLQVAWTYDMLAPVPPASGASTRSAASAASDATPPRGRRSETTPLVVGSVMYLSTAYNRVLALEAETGEKIWEYESAHTPALRGIAYWPGNADLPPQIVFGTSDGWLTSLNAHTGRPVPGFGKEGLVNLREGVADQFPKQPYGMSSPPVIYKDLVITGSHVSERPSIGPAGDVRAWDMHTGKLVWTFHTVPRPGEANHEVWQGNQWVDRASADAWGLLTVDAQRGMVFVPTGTPNTDFWGGDRKGSNLYGSSLLALDAATGRLIWYFQATHHDNWDYDVQAPPALIEVKRNGKSLPAVAQSTKQGLLFFFDRVTGKPIYDVEERPVASDNPTPGDENWPTQPFPVKPPPLARNSFRPEEVATVTPELERFCKELLGIEGGALTGGPYAQYGPKLRVIYPSWTGGGNWGGTSFDPQLGYLFVNTKSQGMINKLVKNPDGAMWNRVGPDNAPTGLGGLFRMPGKNWECAQPPWGELMAVNVNTGDIAWRVPLGSFPELDALHIPKTGIANQGGSIATAAGLVFIGATEDSRFRAFDARTGKELWVTELSEIARTVPIAYQGKNGKQYVAVMAGDGRPGEPSRGGRLYVYRLP
jgi:quinoprotein glucose dehydrogenase